MSGSGPVTIAQIQLEFEIGTKVNVNVDMKFKFGTKVFLTDNGVHARAVMTRPGVFETSSIPYANELHVDIVIIVTTFDAKGQTSLDRNIAICCSRLLDSCESP